MEEEDKNASKEVKEEKLSIVEEAAKIRDEIKAENDRRENLLKEEQKLKAENMLNGSTGGNIPQEEKEETPKEYAARVLKGNLNE